MIQFVVYCTNYGVLRYNDVTFTVRYTWSLLLGWYIPLLTMLILTNHRPL